MGVSRVSQVHDNASALDLILTEEHLQALDAVSLQNPRMIYGLFALGGRQHVVFGGQSVKE